ncbi:hypothetical protein [Labrys neptuniae]
MLGVWLQSLTQDYLDLGLRAGAGLEVRILERPGLWMDDDALEGVRQDLSAVAAANLPGQVLNYGVFAGGRQALGSSIVTIVYRRGENPCPVAFNALAMMDVDLNGRPERVIHLGLVMVDPAERSQGLSWVLYGLTSLLLLARNQLRPFWISNVTQVPAVIGLVAEGYSRSFPNPAGTDGRGFTHLLLARQILQRHRAVFGVGEEAEFDEERFVIANAYTGGSDALKKSFEQAAKHRDTRFNDYCRTVLDYERGDDILQLGVMDIGAARRYLTESVPRESLRGLLLSAAFAGLQGLILPLVYWLAPHRQWGELRPCRK